MSAKRTKPTTALCPWCNAEIVAVGVCLINGEALDGCHAWRCDLCDTYLDCLGLPIQFDKVVFDIPGYPELSLSMTKGQSEASC